MKKTILNAALIAMSITAAKAQTNWKVDAGHSKLGFSVIHMMVSEVEGKFKIYDGTISSASETDFKDAKIEFSTDAGSINTEDEKRDGHLKSADFFDAVKYPKITFKSVSMKADPKNKNTYSVLGDLSMKGVTKKIKLTAVGAAKTVKDPYGNIKYGFKVTGTINRKDFGLNWNAVLEAGGFAVSEEVTLDINIELNKA